MTPDEARAFYQRQLDFLRSKDVEGLVATQYDEDARILSFDFSRRGHDELLAHFRTYLDALGGFELVSTDRFASTDDAIFFEATFDTGAHGRVRSREAWTLRDGRIHTHFTGRLA